MERMLVYALDHTRITPRRLYCEEGLMKGVRKFDCIFEGGRIPRDEIVLQYLFSLLFKTRT